jgi:hypothetical protein
MTVAALCCDIIVRDYSSELSHSGGHGAETDRRSSSDCRAGSSRIDMTWSSGRVQDMAELLLIMRSFILDFCS